MSRSWSHMVSRLFRQSKARTAVRRRPRLNIEQFEDRVVPATLITILDGGVGTLDGFLSATDGTIDATDDAGNPGSVSRAALEGVNPDVNISITAEQNISFADLTAPLALQTQAGNTTQFRAQLFGVTFTDGGDSITTAGGGIIIRAGTLAGVAGLTSNGGDIQVIGNDVALQSPINAGAGRVTLKPESALHDMDLGTETAGSTSLTETELGLVTAGVLQIGETNVGDIVISDAISSPGVATLSLLSGQTITDTAAGSIGFANLRVSAANGVTLDSAANDVDSLAGAVTAGSVGVAFRDADGFVVDTVDGVAGISTELTVSGSFIELNAGGAVTQTAGANLSTRNLVFLGSGPSTMTNPGNGTIFLAANMTGALAYVDQDALTVGSIVGTVSTQGVTTNGGNISLSTVNGPLVVQNTNGGADVNAGAGTVSLKAGSSGNDNALQLNASADVVGTGGVTLQADSMSLGATVDAGGNIANLFPFEASTQINLGGTDGSATLGLSLAELNQVTAGRIQVGALSSVGPVVFFNTGDINITAPINIVGTTALSLFTGGAIVDGNAADPDLTETLLTLASGGAVGASADPLETSVSNLEGGAGSGGFFVANSGTTLTIGGGDGGFTGVTNGQNSITITNDNTLTVSEAISIVGVTGDITLTTTANSINVNAPITNNVTTAGSGNVTITAEDDVAVNAAISAAGTGDIDLTAEPTLGNAGSLTTSTGGTITTEQGDIRIQAMDNVSIGDAVTVQSAPGTITVISEATTGFSSAAGKFTSTAGGTLTTADGDITIQSGDGVSVGAAVSAGGAGNISIQADAAIDGIGDFTSGTGGTLTTAVGDITILGGPDGLHGGNATIGDAISVTGGASGSVTISFAGDIQVNAAVSATGDILITGNSDNSGGQDTRINAPITTAGGDIDITNPGGDIIVLGGGSGYAMSTPAFSFTDISGTGTNAGLNATDDSGVSVPIGFTFNYFGTDYTNIGVSSNGFLSVNGPNGTLSPQVLPNPVSPNGVIAGWWTDLAPFAGGSIDYQTMGAPGSRVFIVQYTNIGHYAGGAGQSTFQFTLHEGSNVIDIDYLVSATDGSHNHGAGIENQTGTVGNNFYYGVAALPNNTAVRFTPPGNGSLASAGGDITLSADDMDLTGSVNAGAGIAALQQADTTTRGITLGGTAAGTLSLSDAELDLVSGSVVRVGRTDNAGDISVIGPITQGPGYNTLHLITGGAVLDNNGSDPDLDVTNLAIEAATGIGSGSTLDVHVGTLAATNSTSGSIQIAENFGNLIIGTVDGVIGVANNATSGFDAAGTFVRADAGSVDINSPVGTAGDNLLVAANGGDNTINALVTNTGGGNITLTATNNLALATGTGGVTATGGSGNIFLGAGGQITINPGGVGVEVQAAGTGNITLDAGAGVLVTGSADIQSGTVSASTGGTITIRSNVGNANGTADIVLGDATAVGPFINTNGDINLDADPDGNCVGGTVVTTATTSLKSPGAAGAANIHISVATDIVLRNALAVGNITVHSCQNIFDDGDDATIYAAGTNIVLDAFGIMGGATPITTADVLSASTATPTANYRAALDVAYGGTIILDQTGSLGNIQIRKVGSGLNTSSVVGVTGAVDIVGTGNQLALISAGGDLTVDFIFTLSGSNNADLFLASVGGNNVMIAGGGAAVNNGATATTTVIASGSTTASISGPPPDGTANIAGTTILLATSGGNIGSAASPIEVNANAVTGRFDGFTNGTVNAVANTGGSAFITDTQNGIRVGQFNAGTDGNVTLNSLGDITPAGSSIVAITHNDNVAEIIGNTISLNVTAASTGTGGQIGLPAQFFEVNSNVLNASTNNSNFWISEVGTGGTAGTAIGLATVGTTSGTTTAFLRVRNGGTITSSAVNGVADMVAPVVNLSNVAGDTPTGGGFGTSTANPLEIDAATLNSNLANGGSEFVRDTAGGLTVQRANTTAGNVGIQAVGGNLVLGNGSSTGSVVLATGGTATLTATGAITSAAPGGVLDVTANSLDASGGTGVGTGGTPIESAVSSAGLAGGTGAAFLFNTGGLTLNSSSADSGVLVRTIDTAAVPTLLAPAEFLTVPAGASISSTNGDIVLQAGDDLTLAAGSLVSAVGNVTLTGDFNSADAGAGSTINVAGAVTSSNPVAVNGGPDNDSIFIDVAANNQAFNVNGNAPVFPTFPGDTLDLNVTGVTTPDITPTGNGSGNYDFDGSRPDVNFTSIENLVPGLTISGRVFLDVNRNGIQDVGELPVAGATVHLDRGNNGSDDAVTNTDANGDYSFANNTPGDYAIHFDANPQFVNTTPNPVVIGFADPTTGINFGTFGRSVILIGGPNSGEVQERDAATSAVIRTFTPYSSFTGTVHTAVADVNGDGYLDLITGAGPGGGPHVQVFSGRDLTVLASFMAYAESFTGGAYVAAGDLNGDGLAEIITGAGQDGGPHVKVFRVLPGVATQEVASFFAYAESVRSGVYVGAGDVSGDGIADIVTGARGGPGFGPHVKVFDSVTQTEIRSFFAYASTFTGGVFVAAGDVNGDGFADIITGAGDTSSHVKVFSGQTGAELASFFAFDPAVPGVAVGTADVDNDGRFDIVAGSRIGSHVKVFDGASLAELDSYLAFGTDLNGVFVGGA